MFKRVALISLTLIGIFSLTVVSFSKTWEDLTSGLNKGESKYEIMFSTSHIGHYKIEVEAIEVPSKETLPTDVVDESYFPKISDYVVTELDNLPPDAWYDKRLVTKVDVALAIGEFEQIDTLQNYIHNFESMLESAGNAVDAYVEQVKTSTININDADAATILQTWEAWKQYERDPTTTWSYVSSDSSIQDNEYHCHRQGYVDREHDTEGDFILSADIVGYTHPYNDFYGLTFRHQDNGAHYAVVYQDVRGSRCGMYTDQLETGVSLVKATGVDAGATVASYSCEAWNLGQYWNLRIEMTKNVIDVYIDDELVITYNDPDAYTEGDYGVVSVSHGKGRFKNIQLIKGAKKTLGEAVSDVKWRDNSLRFVLYAEDSIPLELDTANPDRKKDYEYTIAKLISSNTYLINLGRSSNRWALDEIAKGIQRASEPDVSVYYSNSPITSALNKAKDWILTKVRKQEHTTDWILVGTEVKWDTHYTDSERDLPLNFGEHDGTKKQPQDRNDYSLIPSYTNSMTHLYKDTKVEAERWRYRHYYTFFDNYTVREAYHNQWIPDPEEVFNSTGKFRINYKRKDNPYNPDTSLTNLFNEYRYWSTHYDKKD